MGTYENRRAGLDGSCPAKTAFPPVQVPPLSLVAQFQVGQIERPTEGGTWNQESSKWDKSLEPLFFPGIGRLQGLWQGAFGACATSLQWPTIRTAIHWSPAPTMKFESYDKAPTLFPTIAELGRWNATKSKSAKHSANVFESSVAERLEHASTRNCPTSKTRLSFKDKSKPTC